MTPQEHIDQAEQLLTVKYEDGVPLPVGPSQYEVLQAIAHALIALAVEGGVPHSTPVVQGG